jgi:L-iditol 2-dehydrogenase
VRVEDVDEPRAGPGELLVRMRACGICGSDLMDWYQARRAPVVLGHEPVGEIVEGNGRLPAGERVFVHHHVPCGDCPRCRSGHETLCETFRRTRIVPGGLAELFVVPAENASGDTLPLPDSLGDDEATLVEPLACVLRGQRLAHVGAGSRVLVVGGGQIGLLTAQAARALGAGDVAIAEPLPERRAIAERIGVAAVEPTPVAIPFRPDVVVVCVSAPDAFELAVAVVDEGGVVQLFAPPAPDKRLPLDGTRLLFGELTVQGSYSCGPSDTRRALELLATGVVSGEHIVTHRFPLERAADALAAARSREAVKVVVTA